MNDNCEDDEILGHYFIEETRSEYAAMISPDWCKDFAAVLKNSPEIKDAGNDLMVQWRAATRVAEFPAVMMSMFSAFASSSLRTQPPVTMLPMLAEAWGAAFRSHAPSLVKGTLFNTAMRATKESVRNKVEAATRKGLAAVSTEAIWAMYVAEPAFRFRVWSTMQVCAVAVYNAYDGFLAMCTQGEEQDGIADRLESRYGPVLCQKLFQPRDIQIARLLRHALSHNRGRMTRKLEKMKPRLACHDGLISVYPRDIRRYVAAMGGAAMTLAAHLAVGKK
jgi:hypothetical protein